MVVSENDDFFWLALPERTSKRGAKRIRRSAPPPREKYMNVLSVCAWDKSGLCKWILR